MNVRSLGFVVAMQDAWILKEATGVPAMMALNWEMESFIFIQMGV